jgi:hypothetical protein
MLRLEDRRGRGARREVGVFAIEVKSKIEVGGGGDDPARAFGRIVIGDFKETFVVPLRFWGESDYRASWRRRSKCWRVIRALCLA